MSATLLIVDDEESIRVHLQRYFSRRGLEALTASSGTIALRICESSMVDVVLLDLRLPDIDGLDVLERLKAVSPHTGVIIITAHGDVETAVRAMQMKADNFLLKPVDLKALELLVDRILDDERARSEIVYLKEKISHLSGYGGGLKLRLPPALATTVRAVAESPSTSVLILGETGTGKGVLGRLIHDLSARAARPFVDVNCASLSPELLESELFGHERGAFTDAKEFKRGLVELADGGSLCLDEVAELSPSAQAKLLKVVEEKTFRRLGGTANIQVDARLIAATNQDLERLVKKGSFRRDLFYRLGVMTLELSPLRNRKDDVIPLATDFLSEFARAAAKPIHGFSRTAEDALTGYAWPGNIRELKNVVERAVLLCREDTIQTEHLPANLQHRAMASSRPGGEDLALAGVERRHIAEVLQLCEGNRSQAARLLGIHRSTLLEKIRLYDLGE